MQIILTNLLLLPPLPAQLSVGRRHRLDHEGGGHVADGGSKENLMTHRLKVHLLLQTQICFVFFIPTTDGSFLWTPMLSPEPGELVGPLTRYSATETT